MRTIKRVFAALLAVIMIGSGSLSAYAEEGPRAETIRTDRVAMDQKSTPQPTAAPKPERTGKTKFSLIVSGQKKEYTIDQMHSALGGNIVLLRNSYMDKLVKTDMSFLYEVMDFAVLNLTTKAVIPLTDEEYQTVRDQLRRDYFIQIMFPTLSTFNITNNRDGTYEISFSFNKYNDNNSGNDTDEDVAEKHVQARKVALDIVRNMPSFSKKNDFTKAFYLYSYVTHYIHYTEREYWKNGRGTFLLYDALVEHDTVCAGFAYAFAYLCQLAGIDAIWVHVYNSYADDGHHAVVIARTVIIEARKDKDYHWFDPTWDEGNNLSGFEYYGVSDEFMFRHHDGIYTLMYSHSYYPDCRSDIPYSPVNKANSSFYYWDFDTMKLRERISHTITAGRYCISSMMDQNRVLEIGGYSKENGGNAQIWYNGFIDFQQFDLIKDGDGFIFKNRGSSRVLDVEWGNAVSGTNVQQYEKNHTAAQRWIIKSADYENGTYYIVSDLGDRKLYLEVDGSSASDGANVRVASYTGKENQKWRFTEVNKSSVSDGRYAVTTAVDNNWALTTTNYNKKDGGNVQVYWYQQPRFSHIDFQRFDVYRVSGGYDVFKICGSGLALTVDSGNTSTRNVVQKRYAATNDQKWTMKNAGNGYFYVKSASGYYLECSGNNIQAGKYTGNDNQKWRFNLLMDLEVAA